MNNQDSHYQRGTNGEQVNSKKPSRFSPEGFLRLKLVAGARSQLSRNFGHATESQDFPRSRRA